MEWLTVYALMKVLFWYFSPSCAGNELKHNTLMSAYAFHHDSIRIISLFVLFARNHELLNDAKINGLLQERRNSIAYELELRLSCINLSK